MQSPSFDPELGQIFLKMRTLLGVSLWDMARAVGGEPTVIANLEAGAIDALPPWPELTRLIDAYAHLTGVEPNPILARLLRSKPTQVRYEPRHTAVGDVYTSPGASGWTDYPHQAVSARGTDNRPDAGYFPTTAPPVVTRALAAPPLERGREQRAPSSTGSLSPSRQSPATRSYVNSAALAQTVEAAEPRTGVSQTRRATLSIGRGLGRALRRRVVGLVVVLVVPAIFLVTARLSPGVLYDAVSHLPVVVEVPLRRGIDQLVGVLAPLRDGLTWIDVGDPRLRKSDKLREPGR